jgi:hypothetical protein
MLAADPWLTHCVVENPDGGGARCCILFLEGKMRVLLLIGFASLVTAALIS